MNMNRRERFLYWLFTRCGRHEGMMLSRWMVVVRCVLCPSVMLMMLADRHYNVVTDTYTIDGVKVTRRAWKRMFGGPYPGSWFRIAGRRDDGCILIEQRSRDFEPPTPRSVCEYVKELEERIADLEMGKVKP